ncbi:MAG: adenylate/guanylate cyclase domain-containing protein [Desulfobacterales bacterium]|jgi:class 3 adenylate cyclase/tetratricopeptide (TPR) repeat protein
MECPECQFDNRVGVKFCEECGAKFELECPICRAKIPIGRKFCGECGLKLTASAKILSTDFFDPQSYTPKFLADKILTTRSSIEGERKHVTVLFADVANYTAISEKLDPEEVHQIMDGCFTILTTEIHKYEGTINQFTGDGIMAIFGAPIAHEDHSQRACWASLAIQKALNDYNQQLHKEYGIDFKMRIGLNSGPVVVGSIGDDLRMDYTAIGDTTNVAARMEREARPGSTFVSKSSYTMARDFFEFAPLGKVEIKGKKNPQEVYELIMAGKEKTRFKALAARGLTKFVGRKNSMAALNEPFNRVLTGSGQVVGIVGEAGVGKSRLLMEFINQLPEAEYTYLEGCCLRYGESIIYMPIIEILKSYFDIREVDREQIVKDKIIERTADLDAKLSGLVPILQELLTGKAEYESFSKLAPMQKREKTFESLRDLFIRESQKRPLVLVVEDLHWIDKTSEGFLDYFMGWITNARVMLILLYRPDFSHQWGSKSYYSKIGLTQLRTASSNQLVSALLDEGQVAADLKQMILSRSSGNPLFMEEFTYSLLESGAIQKKGDEFVLTIKASDIQVPDTIQGIIAARMDRLDNRLKRTMQIAAVIGREFTFRLLQEITGKTETIKSYLLNLQGLEFIYEISLFPELEYIFKHALIQEVAYNSLLQRKRKEIHTKIGKAIEAHYPEKLEEFYEILAYHYSKSGKLEKAYHYLKLSGEKATKSFSNWEAFRFYKTALNTLDKLKDDTKTIRRKLEILHLMAIPLQLLGYPENSLQFLKLGESLAEKLGDVKNLSLFLGGIGSYHSVRGGDPLLGIKYSEESFNEAKKIHDIEIMAPVSSRLCAFYIMVGEPSKTATLAPEVIKILEKQNRQQNFFGLGNNVYTALNMYHGHSLGWLGYFEKGEQLCKKGLQFGKKIDTLTGLALAEFLFGYLYMHKGDGANVKKHFQECIRYCEEGEALIFLGLAWTGLGIGHFFVNDMKSALRYVEKGIEIQKNAGIPYYLSFHYFALGLVYLEFGDLEQAEYSFKHALELSNKHDEKWIEGTSRIYLGSTIAQNDESNIKQAEESILKGIKILNARKIKPWSSIGYYILGKQQADIGIAEKAVSNLRKAEKLFKEMGMNYWVGKAQEASIFFSA